jgi:hypothetical protein
MRSDKRWWLVFGIVWSIGPTIATLFGMLMSAFADYATVLLCVCFPFAVVASILGDRSVVRKAVGVVFVAIIPSLTYVGGHALIGVVTKSLIGPDGPLHPGLLTGAYVVVPGIALMNLVATLSMVSGGLVLGITRSRTFWLLVFAPLQQIPLMPLVNPLVFGVAVLLSRPRLPRASDRPSDNSRLTAGR